MYNIAAIMYNTVYLPYNYENSSNLLNGKTCGYIKIE